MEKAKAKLNWSKIIELIKDYFLIALGLFIYTSGWIVFVIPNGLVGGGVSGMGAILLYTLHIPLSVSFFVINVVLVAIALKVLGKGFGIKTVYGILIASLFYEIVPLVYPQEFIDSMVHNGPLLCCLMAGLMTGVGIGMTFIRGGSTGGTDIVALMINKYRNIAPGKIILLIDIVTISCSFFLPNDNGIGVRLANMIYGYIIIAVCGFTIDLFVSGTRQSIQMFIFSKNFGEIADVITKTGRGVTVLTGEGWFTKKEGKILMVVVRKSEMSEIFREVKQIDSDAFISVGSVMGVYGKGFDKIKK